MFTNQAWREIFNWTSNIVDILVLWFLLYYALKFVRNNTRTVQIFKGIILVLAAKFFANLFGLDAVGWLADMFVSWGFVAIIIIFQPEIRGLLERLGKSNMFSRISTLSGNEKESLVNEIVKSVMILSKDQTGALITLEQGQSLADYISTGTVLNSIVTTELLTSIFVTSTPLHDGAVIIQGDRLACASAYFPPTSMDLPNRYGARHRAAIGISEITDSVTIVVSEETGNISIAENGKIRGVDIKELRDYLLRIVCNEEIEVREKKTRTPRQSVYVIEKNTEDKKKKKKEDQSGFFSRFAVKKHPQKDENTALNQLESEEMNVKLPQKHKKQKQVEVLEIKESKAVEDKKLVDSNLKEEKAVNQTAAQEVIEHIETTESDWQPVESSAVQKQEKQPEVINIEHIDLEFSSSRSVKLDDVPFEFDYSRKDRDGGEI
ncbi:MAG: diadenylate cyclase CdaA [Erysipelotrichaceae bacterium]|nr:diadenylate cyclase CdaA [Erysipelotrichaceae bacterium]